MQYYPAKILIHFKSSKVKIAINNKYIINYKIKYKNNASLVIQNRNVHFVEPLLIGCIPIHQKKKVLHILLRSKALMPQMVIQKR